MNALDHIDQIPAGIGHGGLIGALSAAARRSIPVGIHLCDGEIVLGVIATVGVRDVTVRTARGPLIISLDVIGQVRRKDGRPWWPTPSQEP